MKIKDLKANPKNPRTVSDEKLAMLKKALAEFGDLSGVVYNRKTKQLVGGHQRTKNFPPDATIEITTKFKKPTKVGTVALGYVLVNGERHNYREVEWDEIREKAANIAANKGAGEWDLPQLEEWMKEIDEYGFDLDLTMFDGVARADFLHDGQFDAGTESEQGRLDMKKMVECPHCHKEFRCP